MTYQNGAPAHSIGVPTPRVIVESVGVHPCAELACCVRRPPRVAIVVPTPPRVAIVVQTRGSTSSSCRNRGSNRGFSRLHWSAQPTLLSLLWYKPCGRRPPRVAIVVSIQRIRSLIVRGATKPVRIWAPEREVTYQNSAPAHSIGVPTPRVIVESVDVHRLVRS